MLGTMKHFDMKLFPALMRRLRRAFQRNYYAMYSSVYGGVVTDPVLMTIPMDDHMVHRGDGVFEVFKCVNGNIYNLRAHLKRLGNSTKRLYIVPPFGMKEIERIVAETIRAGGHKDCTIHLFVSRGPGSFGVNPYDCPSTQMYVTVVKLNQPFMEGHPAGARVKSSAVPIKPPFFAEVKSCNYLPNALMKKEAEDFGVDFMAGFDERGFLAEGASENMGIVTKRGELLFPKLEHILAGTTMFRVIDLAKRLVKTGGLVRVRFADIPHSDIRRADVMLIVGTTPNVAAVREFDGRKIGDGKPGPIYRKLSALLLDDIHHNRRILTPVSFG
jgi:branched-chain amino acid aminotransferase